MSIQLINLTENTMRAALLTLLLAVAVVPVFAGEKTEAGQIASGKVLIVGITVPAPRAEVWKAFATSEGLSTWLTPNAVVDLRPGGEWTAHYPGGKTGGGTIVSFVPEKEMVLSAMAPERFPTVRTTRTHVVFRFEERGNYTLVTLEQTGWQDSAEWDQAYEYLTAGNAQLFANLHRRFVNGPFDWEKEWGAAAKK